jgi:hypothetical protein
MKAVAKDLLRGARLHDLTAEWVSLHDTDAPVILHDAGPSWEVGIQCGWLPSIFGDKVDAHDPRWQTFVRDAMAEAWSFCMLQGQGSYSVVTPPFGYPVEFLEAALKHVEALQAAGARFSSMGMSPAQPFFYVPNNAFILAADCGISEAEIFNPQTKKEPRPILERALAIARTRWPSWRA